jgi:hypothetical protein
MDITDTSADDSQPASPSESEAVSSPSTISVDREPLGGAKDPAAELATHPGAGAEPAAAQPVTDLATPDSWPAPLELGEPASEAPRRGRRRTIVFAVAAVVVCALVAAAVLLRPQSTESAAKRVMSAADRNAAAGTSHIEATVTLSASDGSGSIPVVEMTADKDPSTGTAHLVIGTGATQSEIRQIDGVVYFKSALADLPDGKSWVRIDPSDVGTAGAQPPTGTDTSQQLALLGGLVGTPTRTGTDTIDGANVTRYDVILDFSKPLDAMAKAAGALGDDTFVKQMQSLDPLTDLHNVPAHVALDDQGRAREFVFTLHINSPQGAVDEETDLKISALGEPVTVDAPPDDQVVPFSQVPDVFKKMTGG